MSRKKPDFWSFTFMSETGARFTVRASNERLARARLAHENPGIDFTLYAREPAGDDDAL